MLTPKADIERAWKQPLTRRMLCAGLAGSGIAALAACRLQTTPPAQAPAQEDARPGRVSFMYSANPETSGFKEIIEAFQAKYPKITYEDLYTTQDYDNKLIASFASGTPPDVFRLNDDYILGYKTRGVLAALDQYIKRSGLKREDFYPQVWDFPVYDGKHYAWFLGANPRLIFYNVDLFKALGLPLPPTKWETNEWTWEDFVEVAKRLTVPGERWGGLLNADTGCEQTFSINYGSPIGIYSKDGKKFTLADPPGYEAMQWLADLSHIYRVQPSPNERQGTSVANLWYQQKLAMVFTSSSSIKAYRQNAQFTWDVTSVPKKVKRDMEASIQTYALAEGAKNPDEGWLLLRFFTEDEAARIFIATGYVIPAAKKYAKDYVTYNAGQPPQNIQLFIEAFNFQTQPNQTLDTQGARRIYRTDRGINGVWKGLRTAKEALTEVRPEVEATIAQLK